ncbi:YvcK family protein [Thermosipho ferrireducens]|uniref:Putative gluconeogenesis factor n=1 Tax=Thermosipho ferrireducens TaxID=2571116 RepID=A0ABX7S652_9BACT|nr:gluconeogenesis factor YvcK family protein [Thermosipho ferrireducens]QTA37343.1 YvcK family protein [Thermosipho ferrireducens]
MRIVTVGGGTGISTLLKGLKQFREIELTAVVTVTDEGGSSGIIREEYSVPPPGDIRNNLVALAKDEEILGKLFNYRFSNGFLSGHTVGNIILTALSKITGSFTKAIELTSEVLAIEGTVLPVSESLIRLVAVYDDGTISVGEKEIMNQKRKKIVNIYIDKPDVFILPDTKDALENADVIVFGPGSLYTSIVSNIIVNGFREAVRKNKRAKIVFVANLMTQSSETYNLTLSEHVKIVEKYLKREMDIIIVSSSKIPEEILKSYEKENSIPVKIDMNDQRVIATDLCDIIKDVDGRLKLRHDPDKIAKVILEHVRRY